MNTPIKCPGCGRESSVAALNLCDGFCSSCRGKAEQPGQAAAGTPTEVHKATPPPLSPGRHSRYGSQDVNFNGIGRMWTGLLENYYGKKLEKEIPAHLVALMMVVLKCNRAAANGQFVDDNFVDAHVYLDIAKECDPRNSGK